MARRGRLKRRLKALGQREDEARRDLGVLVLEMYRREQLDLATLGDRAMEAVSLGGEIESLRGRLGEPPGPREPIHEGGSPPPADTLPTGEEGDEDEPEGPSPAHAVPSHPAVEELTMQVDTADRRLREASNSGRENEEAESAEILALEEELESEKQRVAEALDGARARLEVATERAEREREREIAAARAEAAEWLRGQAGAMRREAERQVREELAEADPQAEPNRQAEPALDAESDPQPIDERLDLNSATFEQLREVGMSVTQANRVIAYRERLHGYRAVDDLDAVPGFSPTSLADLKKRLDA